MQTISRTQRVKLLLLFLFLPLFGHSQSTNELHLSQKLDESRLGLWQQGNYKIYVKLDDLEKRYRQTGNGYLETLKNNSVSDSARNLFQKSADRYLLAAEQLKNAENGFDLRKLIIYFGHDDEKQNTGNSFIVENDVRQLLENGQAAVYKNEERIHILKTLYESSDIGITGMNITICHDSVEDYIFKYYHDYGW